MKLSIDHLLLAPPQNPQGNDGRSAVAGVPRGVDDLRTDVENAAKKGKDADWVVIKNDAEKILEKVAKNLDAAFLWTVAAVQQHGLDGLEAGLRLLHQLLSKYWAVVYPLTDGGKPYERAAILAELGLPTPAFSGPCRILLRLSQRPLMGNGSDGGWTIGQALSVSSPGAWPVATSSASIEDIREALSKAAEDELQQRRAAVESAINSLEGITGLFAEHAPSAKRPNLGATEGVLNDLKSLFHAGKDFAAKKSENKDTTRGNPTVDSVAPGGRADALLGIALVQAFFRTHEPASPLLPLIDLANEVKGFSFIQVLERVSPSELEDLQKVFGADAPDETTDRPSGGKFPKAAAAVSPGKISALSLRTRDDAKAVLQAIDQALFRVDPASPVLALVRMCRAVIDRSYAETCTRLSGQDTDKLIEIFKRKNGPATDKQKN